MSKAVLRGSCRHGNAHLLDELAPAPGADLSISCAHEMRVGGQQAEDGTFVSCQTGKSTRTFSVQHQFILKGQK